MFTVYIRPTWSFFFLFKTNYCDSSRILDECTVYAYLVFTRMTLTADANVPTLHCYLNSSWVLATLYINTICRNASVCAEVRPKIFEVSRSRNAMAVLAAWIAPASSEHTRQGYSSAANRIWEGTEIPLTQSPLRASSRETISRVWLRCCTT